MEKKTNGMHLVGKSNEILSARKWIDRVSRAFQKTGIPMHRFILVPGAKDQAKAR